jgi:hypothetical protein
MRMKRNIILFTVCLLPFFTNAQRWKKARYDFVGGIGSTTFLGELGGANQIGTHFVKDLEFSQSRPCLSAGIRYRLSEYLAARANLAYGRLKGDDKKTTEAFRNFRNLNFVSNVFEFSMHMELAITKEQSGHRYRLRGVKGRRGYEIYTYVFGGIGVLYHNPKAVTAGGKVALQPLHTEGQGLIPTRKPYKRVQICIPAGVGFKYTLKKRWGVGLEIGVRYTFTDYMDDVSTTYVNPTILAQQPDGPKAVEMANRSGEGANPEGMSPTVAFPGQQRGNPQFNDAYVFSMLTVNYKLKVGRSKLPIF